MELKMAQRRPTLKSASYSRTILGWKTSGGGWRVRGEASMGKLLICGQPGRGVEGYLETGEKQRAGRSGSELPATGAAPDKQRPRLQVETCPVTYSWTCLNAVRRIDCDVRIVCMVVQQ